jgi:hypothetical protein
MTNTPNLLQLIPDNYILEKLHQLGPSYYNDKPTADIELRIYNYDRPFFVHIDYLIRQSSFFQKVFENLSINIDVNLAVDVITIHLPFPQHFEPILKYLYDGNDDQFYEILTIDNYQKIRENIEYLVTSVWALKLNQFAKFFKKLLKINLFLSNTVHSFYVINQRL